MASTDLSWSSSRASDCSAPWRSGQLMLTVTYWMAWGRGEEYLEAGEGGLHEFQPFFVGANDVEFGVGDLLASPAGAEVLDDLDHLLVFDIVADGFELVGVHDDVFVFDEFFGKGFEGVEEKFVKSGFKAVESVGEESGNEGKVTRGR